MSTGSKSTRSSSLVNSLRTSMWSAQEDGSRKSCTGNILSSAVGGKEATDG
jgi:hypothetical protein